MYRVFLMIRVSEKLFFSFYLKKNTAGYKFTLSINASTYPLPKSHQ